VQSRIRNLVKKGKYKSINHYFESLLEDSEHIVNVLANKGHIVLCDKHGEVIKYDFERHKEKE